MVRVGSDAVRSRKTGKRKKLEKAPMAKKKSTKQAASKDVTTEAGDAGQAHSATDLVRRLDCVPSRATELDWGIAHLMEAHAGVLTPVDQLPDKVDLREGCGWWKVANQESTGGCVGWALADSVMRWHFVKAGKLPSSQLLSPRFLWMSAKETDEFVERPETFIESSGTSLKAALDIARKYGCVTDALLGFKSNTLYAGSVESFYFQAMHYKISGYVRLGTPREWLQWLATPGKGPILARLEVDQTFRTPVNGRLSLYNPYPPRHPYGGGHAVALVGYENGADFVIRNSWGESWGSGGYAVASSSYVRDAITETYGVLLV